MESLKLIVTSDIHIHDWMPFSSTDEYGRPSRLLQYETLAKDTVELARKYNADMIIVAGDISQVSTQRPRVNQTLGNYFRTLSEFPTVVIPGQHDMDTKEQTIARENCILTEICKDIENIQYFTEPTSFYHTVRGCDFSVLAAPWTSGHDIPEVDNGIIDVFVGHGMVIGSQNLDGYMFQTGFPSETLLDRFRLSIIGDIHNGQTFSENENKVLVPGAPIQANWKDEPNCGIWYVEVPEKGEPSCKFHNIHELRPDYYHKFVYDQTPTELTHSRPKVKIKKSDKIDINIKANKGNSNIHDICEKIIDESKLEHALVVKGYLTEAFENITIGKDKPIANTVSKSVKIENFFTIDKFELDFDEFPDACVIVGDNGLGKTTIPEAIYWCLTGKTTKGVDVSDIKNWHADEDDEVRVEYTASINGQEYTFIRTRGTKTHFWYDVSSDITSSSPVNCGSIRETQADAYALLGISDDRIKLFSYFSAEQTKLFANSGDSDKNDLISQIVGIDIVDDLKMYAKNKSDSIKSEFNDTEIEKNTFLSLWESVEDKLRALIDLHRKNEDLDKTAAIKNLKYRIQTKEIELSAAKEEYDNLSPSPDNLPSHQESLKELTTEQYELYEKVSDINANRYVLESNVTKLKKEYKAAVEGKCPTCKQELESQDALEEFKTKLLEAAAELETASKADKITAKLEVVKGSIIMYEEFINTTTIKQNIINTVHNELRVLNQSLDKISENEEVADEAVIEHLKGELKSHSDEVKTKTLKLTELELNLECWKWLETKLFKRKGPLVQHLNIYGSKLLQDSISGLLADSNIKVKITEELKLLGKFRGRKYAGYKAMSSGQKRITDVVLMVALNNLFSQIYNLENGVLGLAVYDEILSFLDPKYIEVAKSIVDQSVSKKLLIITHDQRLTSMYDSRITVEGNKEGQSTYRKSWK